MTEERTAIDPKRLLKLTRRLVGIYSPSGKEEDIVAYLYGYLKKQGLPVIKQEVSERRGNVIVVPDQKEMKLALVGHLDTVTAFDLEDIGPREENGRIYGLGTADMKGGCAAMIEAYLALIKETGPDPPVGLILVVGEEEEGDGAAAMVETYHAPWAVIGEPTDLKPCLSHFGYLELQLAARGQWRHASLVPPGRTPVESVLRLILKMTDFLAERHPGVVYNIRDLFSSGSGFVVPNLCESWIDIHVPPLEPVTEITVELENLVESAMSGEDIQPTVRFHSIHNGYTLPPQSAPVEKLRQVFDRQNITWAPRPFPSHSDANQLWTNGIRPIILGPGRLEDAHCPDESVAFAQVLQAAKIYYEFCLTAC